jgi:RimJ/RimL family protein N-acetyltransferase
MPEPKREEHELADGTRVVFRPIRPDDADALRHAFERLSPGSRYRRFLGGVNELSDEMVRYLTNVDGENHVAICATVLSLDLKEESIVGVARFVRLPDEPDVAEAAVTVIDDLHRKGLGRLLMMAIARAALEHKVTRFRGQVLVENAPMRHLLEEAGAVFKAQEGDALVFDVSLEPIAAPPGGSPLERVFRAVASRMVVVLSHLYPKAPAPHA